MILSLKQSSHKEEEDEEQNHLFMVEKAPPHKMKRLATRHFFLFLALNPVSLIDLIIFKVMMWCLLFQTDHMENTKLNAMESMILIILW